MPQRKSSPERAAFFNIQYISRDWLRGCAATDVGKAYSKLKHERLIWSNELTLVMLNP